MDIYELIYGCRELIGPFDVSEEKTFRKKTKICFLGKNSAKRTTFSGSPGQETLAPEFSAPTEIIRYIFGQIKISNTCYKIFIIFRRLIKVIIQL